VAASIVAATGGAIGLDRDADAVPPWLQSTNSFEHLITYSISGEVAEIAAATPDGMTLVYTDSEEEEIGFVNITDPSAPTQPWPAVPTDGSPTSVDVTPDGRWALAAVHKEGGDHLLVIRLSDRTAVHQIPLGGQPDSISISPNGRYAAIAIENERPDDEAIPNGEPGFLTILDLVTNKPEKWKTREVELTGIADFVPEDPEVEYVDVNALNVAAITLQENNHIVLVHLPSGRVLNDWNAGTSTHKADLDENGTISFTDTLTGAPREPDGIHWTPLGFLVTANEGDYSGFGPEFHGGRDFTIFNAFGQQVFESKSSMERAVADAGFYNDNRSENGGIEPEGVEVAVYGLKTFLFVGGERCSCVVVYRLELGEDPELIQVLETGDRPEGLVAIPKRNLFITANEDDGDISIFRGIADEAPELPDYPAD
jgi:hypothetical protein